MTFNGFIFALNKKSKFLVLIRKGLFPAREEKHLKGLN